MIRNDVICWIVVLVTFTSLSCNISDSRKPAPPGFQNEFTFELNGEPFWGDASGGVVRARGFDGLQFGGHRFDSTQSPPGPYFQGFNLSAILIDGQTEYPMVFSVQQTPPYFSEGAFFVEHEGDAPIAQYDPIESAENLLTIQRDEAESGPYIFGQFATVAVIEEEVSIAQYFPIETESNRLEINLGESEFGPFAYGEFETIAVVEENVSEFGRRNRRLPDTLRITNGRFRILLSQRDD